MAIILLLDEVPADENESETSLQAAADFVRRVLCWGVTALVSLFNFLALDDFETSKLGSGRGLSAFDPVGIALIISQFAYNIVFYSRLTASPWSDSTREKVLKYISIISVVAVFTIAAFFGAVSTFIRDPDTSFPIHYAYIVLVLDILLMAATTYAVAKSRRT